MLSTTFGRVLVFVLVLVALRVFFHWNVSIVGSLVVTALVYALTRAIEPRSGEKGESDR